jgi:hypothetical protein
LPGQRVIVVAITRKVKIAHTTWPDPARLPPLSG